MLKSLPFYALQGPPGTGKTTIAAKAVVETLGRDRNLHALISAQSHHALDNLAERIIKQLDEKKDHKNKPGLKNSDERLEQSLEKEPPAAQNDEKKEKFVYIRIASDHSKKRVSPQMQKYFFGTVAADCIARIKEADAQIKEKGDIESHQYTDKQKEIRARWKKEAEKSSLQLHSLLTRGANLIFCTTGAATDEHLGASADDIFDWVIVEEAAKAWPTELVMPLIYGQRWTLIGDHKQLPPFGRDEVENILDACANSRYEDLREHGKRKTDYLSVFNLFENMFKDKNKPRPVEELTYQFRMAKPIADLVSQVFYDKDWDTTEELKDIKPPLREPEWLVKDNLIWLNTQNVKNAHEEPLWQNEGEAGVVKNLTDVILKNLIPTRKKDGQEKTLLEQLAILSPYTARLELLESWLNPRLKDCLKTVDSFQGSEAEIVIISLVRTNDKTNPRDRLGFLLDQKRVNVLLSRACSLLILVGNYRHFAETGVDWWEKICKIFEQRGRVVNALECYL